MRGGKSLSAARPRRLLGALTIALGVTLVSGLLHGRMSQRWGMDQQMQSAAKQLQLFPERIGVWQQEASYELGKSAMELLECQGYIHRGYRNQETGDYIKLSVMVGPGSKMSIHVPEICYEASNFSLLGPRQKFSVVVKDQQHSFWTVRFQVNDVSERKVRVVYGWSTDGKWMAPRMPRWSVAGYPVLYKLQLSHVVNDLTAADDSNDELLRSFMRDTVAVLQQQIGSAPDSPVHSPLSQHRRVSSSEKRRHCEVESDTSPLAFPNVSDS